MLEYFTFTLVWLAFGVVLPLSAAIWALRTLRDLKRDQEVVLEHLKVIRMRLHERGRSS